MPTITLTTDFGLEDWFVGTMKGVIRNLAPQAHVIDLTHSIPPGDLQAAAFALAAAWRYFPPGTVHVVVVDPGVGSPRRALAIRAQRQLFLGPDNGILPLALHDLPPRQTRSLENPALFLPNLSRTFHGRDVFAPAAAHLARGFPFSQVGPTVSSILQLAQPTPTRNLRTLQGAIVYVDRFGNAITNLPESWLPSRPSPETRVRAGTRFRAPLVECYAAVPRGQPLAVVGSTGLLELAVHGGSAARSFHLRRGQRVSVRL